MSVKVLIVTPVQRPENFPRIVASRLLLWGLDQAGIEWTLYRPWQKRPDLQQFDAVIFWSYRHRRRDYMALARELEEVCVDMGLPVINSVMACDVHHSFILERFHAQGIPCARFKKFSAFEDFGLGYPVILRRDGVHQGKHLFLARDAEEAERIINRQLAEVRQADSGAAVEPLDLAIEFIDTRFPDGKYRKRRSYVVGDVIIPRQLSLSADWLVNFGSCEVSEQAIAEDREFRRNGETNPELVLRAGQATGSDVVALDYCRASDGRYVFWEGNRHFKMMGDKPYTTTKFEEATGRSAEERREDDEALGHALARLVLSRVAAGRGLAPVFASPHPAAGRPEAPGAVTAP